MGIPNILLIDNDPHFRHSLATYVLTPEGYQVFEADSPAAAQAILADHLIHLVIIDIRLTNDDNPLDKSGLALCAELPPTVPRVVLTGFPEWEAVRSALQVSDDGGRLADGFLFKEEGPEGVLTVIRQVLDAEFEIIPQRRIAVLTSGADSPGMNAAIRAIVRTAMDHDIEVMGIQGGFQGLVNDQMIKLTWQQVTDIMVQNGSILGASRFPEFETPLVRRPALENLVQKHISGLVVIGGDGSLKGAQALVDDLHSQRQSLQIVAIPGTIDNDVAGTDMSLGAASVADAMIEDLRHLLHSAQSRRRIYVVEVPGRFCGYLTLQTALGIGADAIIIPEEVVDVYPPLRQDDPHHWADRINIDATKANFCQQLKQIAKRLETGFERGNRHGFVVLSEGIAQLTSGLLNGEYACRFLEGAIGQWRTYHRPEVRTHILGFPVRGVPPGRFDLWLGARLGAAAVQSLVAKRTAVMLGRAEDQQIIESPFLEVIQKNSHPPREVWPERPKWLTQMPELQQILSRPPKLQNAIQLQHSGFEQRAQVKHRQTQSGAEQRSIRATSLLPVINRQEVDTTIHKNSTNSYGVTLVAGLPFAFPLVIAVKNIQESFERLAPGRFIWYGSDHLHVTFVALMRGRYRNQQQVRRSEIAADLFDYVALLNRKLSETLPFTIEFVAPQITHNGCVILKVNANQANEVNDLRASLALDRPFHALQLHLSIGYLTPTPLFASESEQRRFEEGYQVLTNRTVGELLVDRVWLVHYANRTLNRIVGKIPLTLGQANQLTVEQLLDGLRIA